MRRPSNGLLCSRTSALRRFGCLWWRACSSASGSRGDLLCRRVLSSLRTALLCHAAGLLCFCWRVPSRCAGGGSVQHLLHSELHAYTQLPAGGGAALPAVAQSHRCRLLRSCMVDKRQQLQCVLVRSSRVMPQLRAHAAAAVLPQCSADRRNSAQQQSCVCSLLSPSDFMQPSLFSFMLLLVISMCGCMQRLCCVGQ